MTPESARILVVEDDPPLRKVIVAALRHEGYTVDEQDNGKDADSSIRDLRPDLVLLDVMLPGKNGLDICQEIKKDDKLKNTAVIMMTCLTGDSKLDDTYWQQETGADDFITKPFPVGEMIRRVRKLLD